MLDSVLSALRSGDFAAAESAARQWLAQQPAEPQAEHLLGMSLEAQGDLDGADAAFARALALSPERADTHVARALLAARRRDAAGARSGLDRAIAHDPNSLVAYLSLAQLALAGGDTAEAERQLRIAERINAQHPHLLALHAQVLLLRGQGDTALSVLTRAVAVAPDDALVQGVLGLTLLALGRHAFAEQALRNALALQPNATALRHALLRSLLAQERRDEAAIEVGVLLRETPHDAAALALQGQLAQQRGEVGIARESYERSLLSRPHGGVLAALAALVRNEDDAVAFDATLERVVAAHPHFEPAWVALLGRARGDGLRSATLAERWYTASASIAATELLAQVSEARGEYGHAAELAQQAVARDATRTSAQIVLARNAMRDGDAAAAVARLQPLLAAAKDPAHRRALLGWLGFALDQHGDHAAAATAWREGQGLAPSPAPRPTLDTTPELVDAALARAVDADATHGTPGPALLWTPPGSSPELAAALLREVDGLQLTVDRFSPRPREDDFRVPEAIDLFPATLESSADAFTGAWRAALEQRGHTAAATLDWLPHFDRRTLPMLRAGAPTTRVVAVLRDPRDLLLNWLAFSSPQHYDIRDAAAAGHWLAAALDTAVRLRESNLLATLVLRDGIATGDMAGAADAVARFLTLDATPDPAAAQRLRNGALGLPTAFPDGHWRHYRDALAEAFAPLHPVAARLGYDMH